MCQDSPLGSLVSHHMGHLKGLGKDACPRDMVPCRCAVPLHPRPQLGKPGPSPAASCSRGSHRQDRAFDFLAILNEKAGVVHKHSLQVLGFKVNVFQEKAVHLGFLQLCRVQPYPRSLLGPLASQIADCRSGTACNCTHLLLL